MQPSSRDSHFVGWSAAGFVLICHLLLLLSLPSVRNFTLFAPTDKAIQQAFRSGSLNYPFLFAKNKTLLEGIVAYHAVPQFQFAGPSKQTLNMKTLLSEVGHTAPTVRVLSALARGCMLETVA